MGLSDSEIKQLRENLKNPILVKSMFTELNELMRKGVKTFESRTPKNSIEEDQLKMVIVETESRSYLYNLLELLFLNQLEMQENIELLVDCISQPNNADLLQKLRRKLESG